jgi:uncharacterized protein (TIGR03083 family)
MAEQVLGTGEIAEAVGRERRGFADWLDGLDGADWDARSLCTAWTVREVVAHLTWTTRASIPVLLRAAIRARGSFDRMEVDLARSRAARFTPAELVGQLRESAESSRRFPGSTPMDPLMDLVIHGQDVARPLGRPREVPTEVALPSLVYVAANRFLGGPKRVAGLELVATDAEWSGGGGPAVRGTVVDLLLAASGRPAALPHLSGPGVEVLAGRLATA